MENSNIVDSPFLWSGKKTKLLPQLKPLFPKAKLFVDLFGGSGSVAINSEYEINMYNDLFMGTLIRVVLETSVMEILDHVDSRILEFNLSSSNKEGYYNFKRTITDRKLRDDSYYLDLFTISLFAFNGSLEFNMQKGLTSSFGKRNRRKVVEQILVDFKEKDKKTNLQVSEMDYKLYVDHIVDIVNSSKMDFKDVFIYVDCPYSITRINGYKSDYNDFDLFVILNKLDELGVQWGMSNVFEHKGIINSELIEFSRKHNVNYLNYDYNNLNRTMSSELLKEKSNKTVEVYITNY